MDFYQFGFCLLAVFVVHRADGESTNTTISPSPTYTTSVTNETTITSNVTTSAGTNGTIYSISPTHSASTSPATSSVHPTTPLPVTKAPKPHVTEPSKSFDAGSFFGGIVLGIVLAALFLFGYWWWKNKRKSYHSL